MSKAILTKLTEEDKKSYFKSHGLMNYSSKYIYPQVAWTIIHTATAEDEYK